MAVRIGRPTQGERRARSRTALVEAAARGLSRHGYARLNLEEVASEAGYTRGALYHQFEDKQALALAVIQWVDEAWRAEVGPKIDRETDPVNALMAMARGHGIFCRPAVPRVVMALRVESSGQEHPVGREIERISESGIKRVTRLINAGGRAGSIAPGPPPRTPAVALVGALEGAVMALPGQAPHDALLAPRVAAGVL